MFGAGTPGRALRGRARHVVNSADWRVCSLRCPSLVVSAFLGGAGPLCLGQGCQRCRSPPAGSAQQGGCEKQEPALRRGGRGPGGRGQGLCLSGAVSQGSPPCRVPRHFPRNAQVAGSPTEKVFHRPGDLGSAACLPVVGEPQGLRAARRGNPCLGISRTLIRSQTFFFFVSNSN